MDFPYAHWSKLRSNNVIERLNREIRRRTRVVGTFPDGNSALMLVCARLRHVASKSWGTKLYMSMKHLEDMQKEAANFLPVSCYSYQVANQICEKLLTVPRASLYTKNIILGFLQKEYETLKADDTLTAKGLIDRSLIKLLSMVMSLKRFSNFCILMVGVTGFEPAASTSRT